jgi:hypothetical protein
MEEALFLPGNTAELLIPVFGVGGERFGIGMEAVTQLPQ